MKFLGIYREPAYSPGRHASNDAKILRLVATALERQGVTVRLEELDQARPIRNGFDLIFSMCQGPVALNELSQWKKEGRPVFNDPSASLQTYREALCPRLIENGIPFPHSVFLDTDLDERTAHEQTRRCFNQGAAWMKRSDVHATAPGDVFKLESAHDLSVGLAHFRNRGIPKVVVQSHHEGDEVKFYAVSHHQTVGGKTGFFWPYYPTESEGYPFDEDVLTRLTERAASLIRIGIYGGDAIISPDGTVTLIDLNDWPSFAPCRGAAASAIAHYLKEMHHALIHA